MQQNMGPLTYRYIALEESQHIFLFIIKKNDMPVQYNTVRKYRECNDCVPHPNSLSADPDSAFHTEADPVNKCKKF
jgi:hypothetical protein